MVPRATRVPCSSPLSKLPQRPWCCGCPPSSVGAPLTTRPVCPPQITGTFWQTWKDFEIRHGNEDTIREMLRIKRSVQATYNTQVNFMASQMLKVYSNATGTGEGAPMGAGRGGWGGGERVMGLERSPGGWRGVGMGLSGLWGALMGRGSTHRHQRVGVGMSGAGEHPWVLRV